MTLGERVKKRREALHLSQEQLARQAGIAQGLLSRIERGVTPSPGATVLKGLARALLCSIDWLVDLYDEEHPFNTQMAGAAS